MDTKDIQTIARHVARTGAFVGATCRVCMTVKRPLRDVTEDDGKACTTCIKEQRACPGCGVDVNGIAGCWHDGSGRWHRECAVKAGAAPDISPWEYVPMVLRRPGP